MPIYFSIISFSPLVFLILLLTYTHFVGIFPNISTSALIDSSSELIYWLTELLSTSKSYLIKFDLNDGTHSNQLSLASIYFTLAFTGSVILSVIGKYRNQIEGYKERQIILAESYEDWFKRNENCINFSIMDYFNEDKINNFYTAISSLHGDLNIRNPDKVRDFIKGYDYTIKLMFMLYLAGILSIIIPPIYLNGIFLFFILFSVVFAISLYWLFMNSGFIKEID